MSISGLSASLLASAKAFCRGSILIAISIYPDCSALADFFKSPAKLVPSGVQHFIGGSPGVEGSFCLAGPTQALPAPALDGWGLHYAYWGPHGFPNRPRSQ